MKEYQEHETLDDIERRKIMAYVGDEIGITP